MVEKRSPKDEAAQEPTLASVMLKVVQQDTKWTKAEVDDAVTWLKIFCALIIGIVWGFCLEGASSLIAGVLIVVCVNVWFVRSYLRIEDEDEYGGILTLLQEGAFPAAATFLGAWMLTYSALYAEDAAIHLE
eukprot:jgi/Ulvmu1/7461/UM037_0004.1